MNSVTQWASLSETMQTMLSKKPSEEIGDETIQDIRFSLNTIQKRSERLIEFVGNYRRLTRVPKPVIQTVDIQSFLLNFENLMREEIARNAIVFTQDIKGESLKVKMDPTLIEQVLINLVRNSIHALEENMEKRIDIRAYTEDKAVVPRG